MRGPEAAPFPVDFKEDWLRRQGVKLDPGGAIARSRRITKLVAFQEEHGQSQGEWRIRFKAALIAPLYSHELITNDLEIEECDARANHESWEDMVRLQTEGAYPAAFSKIESPVLMLHGAADPHPGRMISASLKPPFARRSSTSNGTVVATTRGWRELFRKSSSLSSEAGLLATFLRARSDPPNPQIPVRSFRQQLFSSFARGLEAASPTSTNWTCRKWVDAWTAGVADILKLCWLSDHSRLPTHRISGTCTWLPWTEKKRVSKTLFLPTSATFPRVTWLLVATS